MSRCPIHVYVGDHEYAPCGKPTAWIVDTGRQEFSACEDHARDALLYEGAHRVTNDNGEDMEVAQ
jgi:hypothetical protein